MRITVENGWRGPIEGIAKLAAIAPRTDVATVVIPRWALIAMPKIGNAMPWEAKELIVEDVAATRTEITLSCRRSARG